MTMQEILDVLLKAHKPELAKKAGMVAQIWEDGKYTLQKSGDLLWQLTLQGGRANPHLAEFLLQYLPCKKQISPPHAYVFVDTAVAEELSNLINNWEPSPEDPVDGLDPLQQFVAQSYSRQEIAERLNLFLEYEESLTRLLHTDKRLTDDICRRFAASMGDVDVARGEDYYADTVGTICKDALKMIGIDTV